MRMAQQHRREYPSLCAAVESIAPKIGCVPQTLLEWAMRREIDRGCARTWLRRKRPASPRCISHRCELGRRHPTMRQQFTDAPIRMGSQSGEHILGMGIRIMAGGFSRGDQAHDDGGAPSAVHALNLPHITRCKWVQLVFSRPQRLDSSKA